MYAVTSGVTGVTSVSGGAPLSDAWKSVCWMARNGSAGCDAVAAFSAPVRCAFSSAL